MTNKYRLEFRNESGIPDQYVHADSFRIDGNFFLFEQFLPSPSTLYGTVKSVGAFPSNSIFAVRIVNGQETT